MKYIPLFDEVTSALNFGTSHCRVVGGCDLYTTKAAGSDKKLYRNIEKTLNSQYFSLLRYSVSVSPPQEGLSPLALSRPSPFGLLSQTSSRRTFAYLIATLNASHPDYDFSHILSPTDFRRERSLKKVMHTIDVTLCSLRPSTSGISSHTPSEKHHNPTSSSRSKIPNWSPQMWSMIDSEMDLKNCAIFSWAPSDEPFDGDKGSLWQLNYFFFNKNLKRVTYLYVRATPTVTQISRKSAGLPKRCASENESSAKTYAENQLGDMADNDNYMEQAELDEEDSILWNNDTEFDLESSYFISDVDE
ncbi:Repressor of RNA polymerase III transcription maf1 [Golovinomyces cichoracearum]|uniref:Repressor of RNA polymerase III transcription MAF1 n=1 Tax=Golovinomyces cichoracearum TaxID=62708 RepID=A0A420IK40_9PEZI|nr:Repressor of RNA polymerase III transcription maf1 [Golovinomyces cichoracearum]